MSIVAGNKKAAVIAARVAAHCVITINHTCIFNIKASGISSCTSSAPQNKKAASTPKNASGLNVAVHGQAAWSHAVALLCPSILRRNYVTRCDALPSLPRAPLRHTKPSRGYAMPLLYIMKPCCPSQDDTIPSHKSPLLRSSSPLPCFTTLYHRANKPRRAATVLCFTLLHPSCARKSCA